jgi:hypothetical protein
MFSYLSCSQYCFLGNQTTAFLNIWYPLFWIIPRIMILGSSGSSWFHFLSKLPVIFLKNGCIKIYSHQQCTILPYCYIQVLSNAGCPMSSFIGGCSVWTQDFILANQVLYSLSHYTPLLWVFWGRVCRGYAGTGLDPQSTWCLSSAFQVAVIIGMGLLYLAQLSNNSCSDSCAQTAGGLLFGTLHPQGKFVKTQDILTV